MSIVYLNFHSKEDKLSANMSISWQSSQARKQTAQQAEHQLASVDTLHEHRQQQLGCCTNIKRINTLASSAETRHAMDMPRVSNQQLARIRREAGALNAPREVFIYEKPKLYGKLERHGMERLWVRDRASKATNRRRDAELSAGERP